MAYSTLMHCNPFPSSSFLASRPSANSATSMALCSTFTHKNYLCWLTFFRYGYDNINLKGRSKLLVTGTIAICKYASMLV